MNRADSPKPPVAPKPKTTSPLTPVTAPKFPSSPRPDSLHSPNSMFRGPKPPIAPKPRLAAPNEWRASMYLNDSLNKCSNGRLLCVDRGLDEGPQSVPKCSESETDEDYIVVPRALLREDEPTDGGSVGNAALVSPEASGEEEEEHEEGGEACVMDGTGAGEDSAVPAALPAGALSREGEEGTDLAPEDEGEGCVDEPGSQEQVSRSEEEEKLVQPHRECSLEDGGPWAGEGVQSDLLLPHDHGEEHESPNAPGEAEEDGEEGCASADPAGADEGAGPDSPTEDMGQDAEDASEETPQKEEPATGVQEAEMALDCPELLDEGYEEAIGITGGEQVDLGEPPDHEEKTSQEVAAATLEDSTQDEPAEESCQIVPFENDCMEDFVTSLTGSPYEFFPTESTSFCSESCSPLSESAKGLESEQTPKLGLCAEEDPVAGELCGQCGSLQGGAAEGLTAPDVVIVSEEEALDDALANPYVIGVNLPGRAVPGEGGQAASDALGGYGSKEEMNCEVEGGLVPGDRKNTSTRARPHSGKVAGYVPETVPEEAGPEAGPSAPSIGGITEEAGKTLLSLEGKPLEAGRALPAKPRAFTLYPRSFSVEGREIPVSVYQDTEGPGLDDHRIKRKEDNLSLSCVIGSSGSFSQRNHLPSSGTSTPSSMVDIPPPFDLACITKKPITKSSPSLLIESDSPDKYKKKKSSFKRFLALTFKKKTENKLHVDVNVSSSRSSSESSYHGPSRILEVDRRSLSNSPQLKSRTGKLRASESPSSLIFYRDGKRKGVPFSRTVSRVESFEDRSRPPFLPLPLTKPRSISFPSADTSDYENIPAMNSDYENIQIPPQRPARAGAFTKLFEDQSRALSTANENDGYVDMSSFNAFESKQQSTDQDAESTYTEPYKVCPISSAAPKEDLTSDEEQRSSEEEDSASRDPSLTHKVEGQSRALVIAQELLSSEKAYVEMLQHLHLENLQKLVHIEHSVRGQGDLLQPGREFLKEGTLMKVTGKNRRPRHLFLMNDVLLYTYPQKDGKYQLKNTLAVASMKVSRPVMEKVPYALKIETSESCLMLSASSCAERDEWYGCLSRALPEDYKAQALAAFHHSVEIRERLGVSLGERPPTLVPVTHVMMCMNCGCDFSLTLRRHHCHACGKIVCRNCSRNKYPLKYLKDRMAKVCDGCFGELKKRGRAVPGLMRERPVSMSFPLSAPRFSGSAFSSVFHSINPSTFKKQKKVPSALTEVTASGEGSAISGYLSRCKRGKRHWKKLWFVIKGKVLYTYMASEDKVAMESMPLLGFTIAPEKEEGSSEVGPIFHLYHKKTLFYSFKAEDTSSAQRWIEAMEDASVL
ncbi:FYVE, RhoGEF and PH domain-containing protein 5 isoform X3 [Callithrix jacchus]|uniref:FYVE, RhoGEF and PH domain-containing protein 5 isoform X3 n=1 Tax=Callithrix jacchus TaxID=9483 RepID=UPI0023DD0A96|nr:FYVE, RhoGEF and PH domain-containing protein 5 isoform X3 [Callithrix jacchus]